MDEYVGSTVIINLQVCPVGHLFRSKRWEDWRILKQKIESQLYSYSTAGDGIIWSLEDWRIGELLLLYFTRWVKYHNKQQRVRTKCLPSRSPVFLTNDSSRCSLLIIIRKKSKNYRSDGNHKLTQWHSLSNNLPIFQSHALPILHSFNLTIFQSHALPISCSSNLLLFQSHTLPISYSSNITLFQSHTLPISHSS